MNEFVIAILLTYSNKCGMQYKTDYHSGFKTELECKKFGERQAAMYLRTGKTNVEGYEYICYQRN